MTRLHESFTGWGTLLGAALTAISLAVTVIVYEVRVGEGVTHFTRLLESHELRLDALSGKVDKIGQDTAYLRGRLAPVSAPAKDQVTVK